MWRTMILSFKQIGRNKIRSFLTILGIIIGVASVIVLINIIEGVKLQMIESYEKIGINTIEVNTYRKTDAFTLEELDQILAENPGRFAGYSPIVDIENVHMETETDAFVVHVRGTGSNFADLRNFMKKPPMPKDIIELRVCSSFLLEEILVFDFRSFNI